MGIEFNSAQKRAFLNYLNQASQRRLREALSSNDESVRRKAMQQLLAGYPSARNVPLIKNNEESINELLRLYGNNAGPALGEDWATTEAGREAMTRRYDTIRRLLTRSKVCLAIDAGGAVLSNIAALAGQINNNNHQKLAEALLLATRGSKNDRQRDIYGKNPIEQGGELSALQHQRKGLNNAAIGNAAANTIRQITGSITGDLDAARRIAYGAAMQSNTPGAFYDAVGKVTTADKQLRHDNA